MVEDKVVGTYWYVINQGKRWITQGDKPTPTGEYFQRSGTGMGWLCLDKPDFDRKDDVGVTSNDFRDINFPDVEPETPVEIEIVKSGRVYVYES